MEIDLNVDLPSDFDEDEQGHHGVAEELPPDFDEDEQCLPQELPPDHEEASEELKKACTCLRVCYSKMGNDKVRCTRRAVEEMAHVGRLE